MITNRAIKFPAVVVFSFLVLVSVMVTYLIVQKGVFMGIMLLLASLGIFLVALVLKDFRIGFYLVFLMGIFMFYIDRMANLSFPTGTVYDALVALVFFSLFVDQRHHDWTLFKNPVTFMFAIVIFYQFLQFFNPSANSPIAWLVSLRNNTSFLLYIICFQIFSSVKSVTRFTMLWMFVAFIAAAYGIQQHFFGLNSFETAWMNSQQERVNLYIIWGELRVFSLFSDPSSFGLFMSMSGLASMVMAMGPFKSMIRLGFGLLSVIFLISMSYSGTRTAIAMVAAGIAFYIVIMLHNRRTLVASSILVFFGAILFFGPFYGGTMSRLRSTFHASADPSMAVRDVKRLRFQEYIQTHPMGGGLNTVGIVGQRYSPGHELAGPWDPDSGYLLTALETGWIGLIIFLSFFFIVLRCGINSFFSMQDPLLKTYMLVYIVPFLALSVAHFTQDAMFTKPMNVIVYATYALVFRIPSLQKKIFSVELV